ncbi:unnamed protein product, partial [Allacma fusca]
MPFPPKKPNPKVQEFWPEELATFGDTFSKINFLNIRLEGGQDAILEIMKEMPTLGYNVCETFLEQKSTQEWIKKSKFDLIIMDFLFNDCAFGLALKFKAKTIIFGTSHPVQWWYDTFGIFPESSWVPDLHLPYQLPMTFYQKLVTTYIHLGIMYRLNYVYYPMLGSLFQRTLDLPEAPDVAALERETSLVFSCSHFSEEYARSLPPLIVSIGGLHSTDESQKLPKDLEKFINESGPNGFMYVSFGSAAKISEAPKEFRSMFYNALGKSNLRFVWKYETDRTADIPPNVYVGKWMPQQAILAHPKIKGFITHGGLMGIHEAITHAVPLVVFPIFAEQDFNAQRVHRTQRGIMIDPNTLTQDILENAISEVSTNPKYKQNMEKLSKLFKDRPSSPLETAVWWTEYVLRNDDLSSLKPLGIHQTWYQRRLLDVWGFVFAI